MNGGLRGERLSQDIVYLDWCLTIFPPSSVSGDLSSDYEVSTLVLG